MKLKIGVVSFGGPIFRYDIAQDYLNRTIEYLKNTQHEIIIKKDIVLDDETSDETIRKLKNSNLDLIIVQIGTFTQGNNLVKLIKEFKDTPLFAWGHNDPIVPDFSSTPLNSLTGFTMFTSFMTKMEKPFEYFYGDFEDKRVWKKLDDFIDVIWTKKQLKYAKYAIVGSRAPGFYLSMVDELRFRDEIGPEIIYYSIGSLINAANLIENERVEQEVDEIYETKKVSITRKCVEKNIRLELALLDFVNSNNIDAVTVKCWPELQDLYNCAGCGLISILNDRGIIASCEGDLAGLATMDIMHRLTGKPIFFADLVAKAKNDCLKAWHCGFGPSGLAKDGCDIEYTNQATMCNEIGIGVKYEMKLGRVTMCKLSEGKDSYRMLVTKGNTVKPDRKLLGVQTDIKLDAGFDKVLETIVQNGFEQHYAIVHEDISEKLNLFSKWTNIKFIEV